MRTYLIFEDLPMHVEYRVSDMPLTPEGTEIYFKLDLRHPRDPKRIRQIDGAYKVSSRKLIFATGDGSKSSSQGLTQYLGLLPVNK